MRDNPIQFAVVREDPRLEQDVFSRYPARRPLLIASGGCTALTLQAIFPDAEFTLIDPNAAQIQHVKVKMHALQETNPALRNSLFNVESDDPEGLNECGNFESLFRGLRQMLHDLVLPYAGWRRFFMASGAIDDIHSEVFGNPYWPVAFELFFSDSLLEAIERTAAPVCVGIDPVVDRLPAGNVASAMGAVMVGIGGNDNALIPDRSSVMVNSSSKSLFPSTAPSKSTPIV